MRYLLDANTVIALLNDKNLVCRQRARQHELGAVGISVIVAYELFYGAFKSRRSLENVALIDGLCFEILEFDKEDARQPGEIRALLSAKGTPIGPYDVLIAGQAKARDLILVTNNTSEFARVPDLQLEDWST